jgi:hypothetical protein
MELERALARYFKPGNRGPRKSILTSPFLENEAAKRVPEEQSIRVVFDAAASRSQTKSAVNAQSAVVTML